MGIPVPHHLYETKEQMITVDVNGNQIDTFDGMKIPMKMENPLFSPNIINEGYSLAFSLPKTPRNKALIKAYLSTFDVKFKGVLVFRAYILNHSDNSDTIDVNVITDSKYLRRLSETTMLADLDLDTFPICDEDAAAPTKVVKWANHMHETMNTPKKEQTHVFPTISTFGYNNFTEEAEPADQNPMMEYYGRMVNRTVSGFYKLNFQVPTAAGKQWVTTVAPCPKANYLFKKIIEKFGLKLHINELENVQEFIDLFIFNNQVLDRYEDDGTYTWNTTGTEINLVNHVPNCSVFAFFQFLNETFDAYFVFRGNELNIHLSKNAISQKPKNVTRFASEVFNQEKQEKTGNNFSYDIPDEMLTYFRVFDVNQDPGVIEYINLYEVLSSPYSKITNNENQLTALPLPTQLFPLGSGQPISYAQHLDIVDSTEPWLYDGYGQLSSFARSPYYLKSDEYQNDAQIFDRIVFGCYRGVWDSVQPDYDEDGNYNPAGNTTFGHPFTYNFRKGGYLGQSGAPEIQSVINHIFGQSSVYINGEDNAFQLYRKPKQNLLYGAGSKTKLLYLPFYELLNLIKWKEIKHVFQQKNESFTGYVKTVSFTLSNQGVSATEVEYLVPDKGLKGEFNDDFNEDFFLE